MSQVRLVVCLQVILVWACGGWAGQEDSQHLLIDLPFDGDAVARHQPEQMRIRPYGEPAFVGGVADEAIVVGGEDRVLLTPTNEHFEIEQGTCMFWAAPQDWSPASTSTHQFFVSMIRTGADSPDLLLYKLPDDPVLRLLVRRGKGPGTATVEKSIVSWQSGEWRQIAFTWSAEGYSLYMNGEQIGRSAPLPEHPTRWGPIAVGTAYPGWAKLDEQKTAVDDLRVYDRAMTSDEVAALFAQQLEDRPELKQMMAPRAGDTEAFEDGRSPKNWALAANGAVVLASSFADYEEAYTDNLIDGDADTAWRSRGSDLPHWVELRWRYPKRLSMLRLREVEPSAAENVRVQRWAGGPAWIDVDATRRLDDRGRIVLDFSEVVSDRLRLVIEKNSGPATWLAELEAYGPEQPDPVALRPYWRASHIWFDEPTQIVQQEPRYFRTTFNVADASAVDRAVIQLYTNDLYEVLVNGEPVARGNRSTGPVDVAEHLVAGENCLGIVATATSNPGWPRMAVAAELTINEEDSSRYVGTDESWQVSDVEENGWHQADFDASDWSAPLVIGRVGHALWGRVAYTDAGVKEQVVLRQAEVVEDQPRRPGQPVTVRLTLEPTQPLRHDYLFVYEMGEEAVVASYGDYIFQRGLIVPDTPTRDWAAGEPMTIEAEVRLPAHAPHGEAPMRVRGYNLSRGPGLEMVDASGRPVERVGSFEVQRFDEEPAHPAEPMQARLTNEGTIKAFELNGEPVVPLLWAHQIPTHEKLHLAAETGIHLYVPRAAPLKVDGTADTLERICRQLDQHIQNIIRIDRDARILVRLELRLSPAWLADHPEARLWTASGGFGPHSYFSREHEELVLEHCEKVVQYLQKQPYGTRIFGYHFFSAGVPDSVLGGVTDNRFQPDRSKITLGDYNPQAIEAFQRWLRVKYENSPARLQAAWNDDRVTFDTAQPKIKTLTREGTDGGIFRDPADAPMAPDYFEFLSGGIFRFYEKVGAKFKEASDGRPITGTYFGYNAYHTTAYGTVGAPLQNNNFALTRSFESDALDFHAMVPDYAFRLEGTHHERMNTFDSLRLSSRQYMSELDLRTVTASSTRHGRHRSVRESVDILKRDLGTAILDGTAAWFADLEVPGLRGVGFYVDRDVMQVIRRSAEIYQQTLDVERPTLAEIAVILPTRDWFHQDIYRAPPLYYNLVHRMLFRELSQIGAPFDIYRPEEIGVVADEPRYRLVIMIGGAALTDAERRDVATLKHDGRTLMWFYAPGYVNPAGGLDPGRIAGVTGIAVEPRGSEDASSYRFEPDTSIPLPSGAVMTYNSYLNPRARDVYDATLRPAFRVVEVKAEPLGRYANDDVALAMVRHADWTSIYSALPYMDAEGLRGVAQAAGVHLYAPLGTVVNAAGPFLLIHADHQEHATVPLRLPQDSQVYDLYTSDLLSQRIRLLHLPMDTTSTYLLQIDRNK